MKKIFLILSLAIFSLGYGQENTGTAPIAESPTFKKNELKGNAIYLIAGAFDVTYERIISEESGVGGSLFVAFTDDWTQRFSLTGFYRYYFGKKPAQGFFVEGFGSLNQFDNTDADDDYYYYDGYDPAYQNDAYNEDVITDFALGFGLGSKWVTKKGFVFEFYAGIGRNLFNDESKDYNTQIMGRGGINLGYRF